MAVLETIYQSVVDGNMNGATSGVNAALAEGIAPADILNKGLIAAMTEVGRLFEEGEYFVPEMLIAARAMQASVAILKPKLKDADVKPLGSIDLLHAFRAHALAMLQRARRLPFFETRLQIPVAIPEDLMGLKLQAMRNNPSRQPLEIADIHLLMRQCAATMDWELAEHYFVLFGQQQLFQELRTIYHAVD